MHRWVSHQANSQSSRHSLKLSSTNYLGRVTCVEVPQYRIRHIVCTTPNFFVNASASHFLTLTWHHVCPGIPPGLITPHMAFFTQRGFLFFVQLQSVVKALSFISFRRLYCETTTTNGQGTCKDRQRASTLVESVLMRPGQTRNVQSRRVEHGQPVTARVNGLSQKI